MLALLRTTLVLLGTALLLAAPAPAATGSDADPTKYVPSRATPAQIEAAEPAQKYLTGIAKGFPPICTNLFEEKLENTGAKSDSDRVDIGVPAVELTGLQPGRSYSYCFFVQNVGKAPISFRVSAAELVGADDPDQKQNLVRPPVSVGTWIHPTTTSFTVKPGERYYVPYVIRVPDNPPAGSVAGALEIVRGDSRETPGASIVLTMLHKVIINFPGGENRPLRITNVHAPRILSRDMGQESYAVRLVAHNDGTMIDSHRTELTMKGLGRTIGKQTSDPSLLLPGSADRVEVRIRDVPWIGLYRPKATVIGRAGKVPVELPWLIVLPPWPFVLAIVLAILYPLVQLLRRWRRNRAEWRQYLDEEDPDADEYDDEWYATAPTRDD